LSRKLLERPGAFVMGSNDYYAPMLKNPVRYLLPAREVRLGKRRLPTEDLREGFLAAGWLDLDNARARAFKIVVLEVRPSNHHALTLYESFGFRVVGRRHGYYYDTGEDALVMEIALTGQSTPRGNQAAR